MVSAVRIGKPRDVLNRIGVLREKRADALGGIDGYGFELVFCHPGPDQKLNGQKQMYCKNANLLQLAQTTIYIHI